MIKDNELPMSSYSDETIQYILDWPYHDRVYFMQEVRAVGQARGLQPSSRADLDNRARVVYEAQQTALRAT